MSVSRREFLAGGIAAGGIAAGAAGLVVERGDTALAKVSDSQQPASGAGSFSFVHLTDQHVTHRRHAPQGYQKCIAAINATQPAPDFVLMGGDMVFDGAYTAKSDYENQIRLFNDLTRELKYPRHPCLGNHDLRGWRAREWRSARTPGYGQKMIMEGLAGKETDYGSH